MCMGSLKIKTLLESCFHAPPSAHRVQYRFLGLNESKIDFAAHTTNPTLGLAVCTKLLNAYIPWMQFICLNYVIYVRNVLCNSIVL